MTETEEYWNKEFTKYPWIGREPWYLHRNFCLLDIVKEEKFKTVFEFAGATGLFAEMFLDRHPEVKEYFLSDFSSVACKLAEKHLERHSHRINIHPINILKDFVEWNSFDLIICTGMEHFPEGFDFEVLNHLEKGTRILWSLATFETETGTHLHPYPSLEYVKNRLSPYLSRVTSILCDLRNRVFQSRKGSIRLLVEPVILLYGVKSF